MAIATWKTGWRLWGVSLWDFCGAQRARLDAHTTVIRGSLPCCRLALFTAFMKWSLFPRFSVPLCRKKKSRPHLFSLLQLSVRKKKSLFLWKYFANWKALDKHRFHSWIRRLFDCEEKQRDHVFWNKPLDMLYLFSDYFGRSRLLLMKFSNNNIRTHLQCLEKPSDWNESFQGDSHLHLVCQWHWQKRTRTLWWIKTVACTVANSVFCVCVTRACAEK